MSAPKTMGTAAIVEHAQDRARAVEKRYKRLTAEDRERLRAAEQALDRAHLELQAVIKEIRDRVGDSPESANEVIYAKLGVPENGGEMES